MFLTLHKMSPNLNGHQNLIDMNIGTSIHGCFIFPISIIIIALLYYLVSWVEVLS